MSTSIPRFILRRTVMTVLGIDMNASVIHSSQLRPGNFIVATA